jgi:hypothetical protein
VAKNIARAKVADQNLQRALDGIVDALNLMISETPSGRIFEDITIPAGGFVDISHGFGSRPNGWTVNRKTSTGNNDLYEIRLGDVLEKRLIRIASTVGFTGELFIF